MTNPQRFLRRLLLSLWLVSCFIGCDLRNAVVLFTWNHAVLSGLHAISGLVASTASEFLVGVCGCHSVVGSPEKNFPSPASSVIFSCLWFFGKPELLVFFTSAWYVAEVHHFLRNLHKTLQLLCRDTPGICHRRRCHCRNRRANIQKILTHYVTHI